MQELHDFCGFEYYGAKHLENYFTGFLQLYCLPKKFGVDKRTSHLSSMIVTKQVTHEVALKKLKEPLYNKTWLGKAVKMFKEKLDITDPEFLNVMHQPTHQHTDYKIDLKYQCYKSNKSYIYEFYMWMLNKTLRILEYFIYKISVKGNTTNNINMYPNNTHKKSAYDTSFMRKLRRCQW